MITHMFDYAYLHAYMPDGATNIVCESEGYRLRREQSSCAFKAHVIVDVHELGTFVINEDVLTVSIPQSEHITEHGHNCGTVSQSSGRRPPPVSGGRVEQQFTVRHALQLEMHRLLGQ
jgi:hypothetical protein